MVKHWHQMSEANIEVIMKSIHDPSCVYLHQHLTTEGIDTTEPMTEIPEGWMFLRQLPKKIRKAEVWEMIVTCFDHLSEVHAHMSSFAANISLLAKICNPEMYDMVLKVTVRPMIQVNILEHYLSPVQDPPPKDDHRRKVGTAREGLASPGEFGMSYKRTKIRTHQASCCCHLVMPQMKVLQQWHGPKKHVPHLRFGPRQLSKLLSGKVVELGGTSGTTKGKHKRSHTAVCEGNMAGGGHQTLPQRSE